MELFNRVQDLSCGIILIAIVWNIVFTICKRDFNNFLRNMLLCGIAMFLVQEPEMFMNLFKQTITFLIDFVISILGGTN